ncbi:MAG TPA: thiamine phosphate synthase [Vulgatibacter sp.]|nr:thiamine phosphate synthase [Vulgatibacter sp.]
MRIHGLYAIADPSVLGDRPLPDLCERLARAGASVVQIRWKGAPARELLAAAKAALPRVHAAGASLVINDRPDVALLAGADGVHVGAEDLPVAEVRALVGDRLAIGATVRDLAGARAAAAAGADHVGFGPVFPTATKVVDAAPRGLEMLREVCAGSPIPVVAIAGIGLANVGEVADAGASAAAVVSELLRAESIEAHGRALLEAFQAGARSR